MAHNSTGTASHQIAGVPTNNTARTQELVPHPEMFLSSMAYSSGRSDIGQVHGLDSHGWWLPFELVSVEWNV
ncbi:Uncharacterised protein [Mycobacteroides abscessus subsp. abscessus]|nr:Uncharacterised protein [Mycobacteroides abscessus subsp. abscessus]SKM34662.1 Uncharacterised protein [Mycobacteroides abscessus subsp. abscessus]